MKNFDVYQAITDDILARMEELGTDWLSPFSKLNRIPRNGVTKKDYNGGNVLWLALCGGGDSEFASYKQWQSVGGQVRKGEKGHMIMFFKVLEKECPKTGTIQKIPMPKYSRVFGRSQVDGLEEIEAEVLEPQVKHEKAQAFIDSTGCNYKHQVGSGAFYSPSNDLIVMPAWSDWKAESEEQKSEDYYLTFLHELTHWTGHKTRCDRFLLKESKAEYAFEELIAELGSAYLGTELGFSAKSRDDHAKYLNCWISALKNDKKFIVQAASQARKALEFLHTKIETQQAA